MNKLVQTVLLFVAVALSSTAAAGVGSACESALEGKFGCYNSDFLVCANGKWMRQNVCQGKCSEDPATSIYCLVTFDNGAMRYNPRTAVNSFETATSPSTGNVMPNPVAAAPRAGAAPMQTMPKPQPARVPVRAQMGTQRNALTAAQSPRRPVPADSYFDQPPQYANRMRGGFNDYNRDAGNYENMDAYFKETYGEY